MPQCLDIVYCLTVSEVAGQGLGVNNSLENATRLWTTNKGGGHVSGPAETIPVITDFILQMIKIVCGLC